MELKTRKDSIDIAKAIAIICVISAHCNAIPDNSSRMVFVQSALLNNFSKAGVILLFSVSGFLFHIKNTDRSYLINKMCMIIIPWLFSGFIVYAYVHLRKPPFSFIGLINFLLGNSSYLYYLTILMIFYLLFSIPFMRNRFVLMTCIFLGFVHVIFVPDSLKMLSAKAEPALSMNLNPINWIQYFAFGLLIQNESINCRLKSNNFIMWVIILIYPIIIFVISFLEIRIEYWYGLNPIIASLGAVSILFLGIMLSKVNIHSFIKTVGKETLFIYLWHMPIAGIIAKIFNIGYLSLFVLIRPLIVLIIVCFAMQLLIKILNKQKKIRVLLGIR